jgi:hypothetical protein
MINQSTSASKFIKECVGILRCSIKFWIRYWCFIIHKCNHQLMQLYNSVVNGLGNFFKTYVIGLKTLSENDRSVDQVKLLNLVLNTLE